MNKAKTVQDIGEFALIKRLTRGLKSGRSVVLGPGDDCAAVRVSQDGLMLMTADMLVEGVDFLPREDPRLIGRKALAVSLSDIAACGGVPRYALVNLGIPKRYPLSRIEGISRGLKKLAEEYKVNIIGGDISSCDKLVIDVSLTGFVENVKLVRRSGAKPAEVIFVSGTLGGSIHGRHLRFTPRVREARYLVNNFKVSSMIDISDGLWQDLGHLMSASNTGAVVYEDLLPVSCEAGGIEDALTSGEDFELLFTLPFSEAARLLANSGGFAFRQIGFVLHKRMGISLVDKRLSVKTVSKAGFRHC